MEAPQGILGRQQELGTLELSMRYGKEKVHGRRNEDGNRAFGCWAPDQEGTREWRGGGAEEEGTGVP